VKTPGGGVKKSESLKEDQRGRKIYKILAYYINHIGINSGIKDEQSVRYRLTNTENVITCCGCDSRRW
jgi:hypothetical protein